MRRQTRALLGGMTLLGLGLTCLAKTPSFSGKIVAYDLIAHNAKAGGFVENREVVILDVPTEKKKYVKIMFQGYGTQQVEEKYFAGDAALTVRAFRDKACDEKSPSIVKEMSADQKTGMYVLSDAYKTSPPPKLKNLECYVALPQKK